MKTAIIIIADPKFATEEATARVFNALALAEEGKRPGGSSGSYVYRHRCTVARGTRPARSPANALYENVRGVVKGVSCGCAAVFDATEAVEACGVPLIKENPIHGTPGLASVRRYFVEGWDTIVF
jgi:hypothetical protein